LKNLLGDPAQKTRVPVFSQRNADANQSKISPPSP
jgi:hypothetical protein